MANAGYDIGISEPIWWITPLIPIYLLHQFEEHYWPGGFKEFINHRFFWILGAGVPLDDKIVLWTNLPLVWVALPPFTVLGIINIYMTVWIPVFWITNGPLHLGAGLKWQCFNPGLLTGLFLLIPVGGYSVYLMAAPSLIPSAYWLFSIFLAFIIHVTIARGRAATFHFKFP